MKMFEVTDPKLLDKMFVLSKIIIEYSVLILYDKYTQGPDGFIRGRTDAKP